jgi:hypothetical protein
MGIFSFLTRPSNSAPVANEWEAKQSVKAPVKDVRPITEIIQEEFDLEMAQMLSELNIRPELERIETELKARHTALKSLGFINNPDVLEVEKLEKENNYRLQTIKANDLTLEGYNHFRIKYPLHKIIFKETLEKVCQKYGLGYAAVRQFTGTIPQKNIDDMMRVKIDSHDRAVLRYNSYSENKPSELEIERSEKRLEFSYSQDYYKRISGSKDDKVVWSPLVIAAPPDQFLDCVGKDPNGKMKFNPMKNEDPIVMQPLSYGDSDIYFLILTAWGPEASDPDIVNERFN